MNYGDTASKLQQFTLGVSDSKICVPKNRCSTTELKKDMGERKERGKYGGEEKEEGRREGWRELGKEERKKKRKERMQKSLEGAESQFMQNSRSRLWADRSSCMVLRYSGGVHCVPASHTQTATGTLLFHVCSNPHSSTVNPTP